MLRRLAAAATDDIQKARVSPFANMARHCLRPQIILAECIRQAGIGMSANKAIGNTR